MAWGHLPRGSQSQADLKVIVDNGLKVSLWSAATQETTFIGHLCQANIIKVQESFGIVFLVTQITNLPTQFKIHVESEQFPLMLGVQCSPICLLELHQFNIL